MSATTSIEWTDATWSPIRVRRRDTGKVGQHCERVSPGCTNCYAARHNGRNLPNGGTGLDYIRASRDLVETFVDNHVLVQPLRWRKSKRIFVQNQTDLFGEWVSDDQRDRVFAVMALAPQHTFQLLTKRPERMREYLTMDLAARAGGWCRKDKIEARATETSPSLSLQHCPPDCPLPNVWLGVTAEDQQRAEERIPILLDTPAAVHFVSAEPLLGPIDFRRIPNPSPPAAGCPSGRPSRGVRWIIVGGESGPGARPCDVAWIRSIVEQCKRAGVPAFVKQLGAAPAVSGAEADSRHPTFKALEFGLRDRKGGDPSEWPEDLRVREFPREAVRA